LPAHPLATRRADDHEAAVRGAHELARPLVKEHLSGGARRLVERVHPLRQVVEVLPVAIPLGALVVRRAGRPLGKPLADAQPARGRVTLALLLGEAADPARAPVVRAVASE